MSDRRPLIIGLVLAALLGFAFFHFAVQPKLDQRADLDEQVEQKQSELTEAQALLADNTAAREKVRRTAAARVRLGTAVPDQPQTGALVVTLTNLTERSGAKLTGVDFSGGAPGTDASATTAATAAEDGATAPSPLTPLSVTVTMSGSYPAVQKALKRIRNLVRVDDGHVRVSGRLVAVDSVTLDQSDDEAAKGLTATVAARAFSAATPTASGDAASADAATTGTATPAPAASSSTTTTTTK